MPERNVLKVGSRLAEVPLVTRTSWSILEKAAFPVFTLCEVVGVSRNAGFAPGPAKSHTE